VCAIEGTPGLTSADATSMIVSLPPPSPLVVAGAFKAESESPSDFRDKGLVSDIVEGNSKSARYGRL
jgi:hypothetical protein